MAFTSNAAIAIFNASRPKPPALIITTLSPLSRLAFFNALYAVRPLQA
ncbi:hypothetical protein OAX98_01710 [Gammaproteobacteria bacterium]|nr:hypothetical protein [Gammaproteobacteria bacterium]